jgi:hypothetical protein
MIKIQQYSSHHWAGSNTIGNPLRKETLSFMDSAPLSNGLSLAPASYLSSMVSHPNHASIDMAKKTSWINQQAFLNPKSFDHLMVHLTANHFGLPPKQHRYKRHQKQEEDQDIESSWEPLNLQPTYPSVTRYFYRDRKGQKQCVLLPSSPKTKR